MQTIQDQDQRNSGIPVHPERSAIVLAVIVGALAGGLLGVFAFVSAPWVVAFAVAGALLAAAAATLGMRKTNRDFIHDAELDREIGVTGGSLGVPRRPQR